MTGSPRHGKFARPKVVAEGWSDEDIDRIIDDERKAAQPRGWSSTPTSSSAPSSSKGRGPAARGAGSIGMGARSRARSRSGKFWRYCDAHASLRQIAPSFLDHVRSVEISTTTSFSNWRFNDNADVIVSGDADLLALATFRGIPITTPAAFGRARR
jgi:hypothetical protein